jgi:exodeoxyribonuclease-3
MKILSWNVNGLRSVAKKGFRAFLESSGAEIVAVQETRARLDQLPDEVREIPGWHLNLVAGERPGYSGVALYSRRLPDSVTPGLGVTKFDVEGRLVQARFGELLVVNGYFPNGNGTDRDNSRIPYKLAFYRALFKALEAERAAGRPILVMGDFNSAHKEIDLARPKENRETSGFRPEERKELDRWLTKGWTDTFRHYEPGPGHYSWWSQRAGVREKNIGWRIDLVAASGGAMPHLRGAFILPHVTGSDHCPVGVDVDEAICGAAPTRRRAG